MDEVVAIDDDDDDVMIVDGAIDMEDACNRVLTTSNGFVIHAATVPAAPPDSKLFIWVEIDT
jgi:hypothetical protein